MSWERVRVLAGKITATMGLFGGDKEEESAIVEAPEGEGNPVGEDGGDVVATVEADAEVAEWK